MSSLQEIQEFVNQIEIFDTHEHLAGFDWGFTTMDAPQGFAHPHKSLPHVLMNDMLLYFMAATGHPVRDLAVWKWKLEDSEAYWKAIEPILDEVRGAAVYTVIRRGLQELYGFEGDDITQDNWKALNEKVISTYQTKGAPQWMLEVFKRARVKKIIQMAHLP